MADINKLLAEIESLSGDPRSSEPLDWLDVATYNQSSAPLSPAEKILGYSRSYLAGPTYNYSDNLEAMVNSLFGADYNSKLEEIRGQQKRFKEKTDYLDNAVELASGAVLNPLGVFGKAVKPVSTAAETAASLFSPIRKAAQVIVPAAQAARELPALGTAIKVAASPVGQAALAGAGAADGEDVLKTAATSAALGAGLSALGSVVGKGLTETARGADRLKLSAYGIGSADIAKQIRKLGDEAAELGDASQIPLVKTLNKAEKEGLIDAGNDIITNAGNVSKKQKDLGGKLSSLLAKADEVSAPSANFEFNNLNQYIDGLAGTAQNKAWAAAGDEIDAIASQIGRGTLKDLQRIKVGLNYKFDQNPYSDDVIKAIRSDLRAEIEKRVDGLADAGKLSKGDAGKVRMLNHEWGNLAELKDAFMRRAHKDVQGDAVEDVFNASRTSGGVGVPITATAASGNPIPMALGALATAVRVPESKSAIADALRDPATRVPIEMAGKILPEVVTGRNVAQGKAIYDEEFLPPEVASGGGEGIRNLLSEIEKLSAAPPAQPSTASEVFKNTSMSKPDKDFGAKVDKVAANLGIEGENLLKVMRFETAGTLDSAAKNKAGSGATGLIQFMPATAKALTGADTKEAAIKIMESMTPTEQLDYVEKYLKPFKGKIKSLDDLYMAVLYPKAIGKDSEYALFKKGTTAYWQNRGLDINKDGVITKAEATSKVVEA